MGNFSITYIIAIDRLVRTKEIIETRGLNPQVMSNINMATAISYGWLNQQDFRLTLGSDFSTTQDIKSSQSLVNNNNFKLVTKSLPNKNFGYVYFDIEQTWDFYNNTISNQMPNSIPMEMEAIANSLEAIAMTSSMINPNTAQMDLMLTVKTN